MKFTRRTVLRASAAAAISTAIGESIVMGDETVKHLIVDTHQHMWDLSRLKLPWLEHAEPVLRQIYGPAEYAKAVAGLNMQAVYMEVDVAPEDRDAEAQYVDDLCWSKKSMTRASVIGGRPDAPGFAEFIKRHSQSPWVKGVRKVLFDITPDTLLGKEFLSGIHLLGKLDLSFDLCLTATRLADAVRLCESAPHTRFVLDHCGNADVKAFLPNSEEKPAHDPDQWKRDMERLAKLRNVICKISGIVAGAPEKWSPEQLAPIVNHCLDTFGPDRVVFGGDWPVCLKRATLKQWIDALKQIIAARPEEDRNKLWCGNAVGFYTFAN